MYIIVKVLLRTGMKNENPSPRSYCTTCSNQSSRILVTVAKKKFFSESSFVSSIPVSIMNLSETESLLPNRALLLQRPLALLWWHYFLRLI